MNKGMFSYLFVFVLLWLVGCGPAPVTPTATIEIAAASPIPTDTPTLSPSATPTMTRTRSAAAITVTPSATPIPILTATRSEGLPTPLPAPVWAEGITPLLTLDHGEASWSPTSNEVLLAVCPPYRPREMELPPNGTIYYAAAPDFTTSTLIFTDFYCPGMFSISEGVDITWSQDGQSTIFVGIDAKKDYSPASLDSGPATIWSWQRKTSEVVTIVSTTNTIRIPAFVTWVNSTTILFSDYASGGTYFGYLLNTVTGALSSEFATHGQGSFSVDSVSGTYIGTNTSYFGDIPVTVMVISLEDAWIPKQTDSVWGDLIHLNDPYAQINERPMPNSAFQGWLPSTNTMLVRTWLITDPALCLQGQPCTENNQLQWWEVTTDQLQPFLPFGLNATLSPNGNTVAVTTNGPVEISGDGQPLQELPAPENPDSSNYLLLVDRVGGKALLPSLPTGYGEQFSPDGQYLAFYTTQQLLLDAEGKPTGDVLPGSTTQLNLLDLTSNQLLTAVPVSSDGYPLFFLWSPNSRKILFRDASDNLMVYDLPTRKLIPITLNGKNQISRASWSFDGQYLSLQLRVDFEMAKVIIVPVPE